MLHLLIEVLFYIVGCIIQINCELSIKVVGRKGCRVEEGAFRIILRGQRDRLVQICTSTIPRDLSDKYKKQPAQKSLNIKKV